MLACAPIWHSTSFDFAAASDNCWASKLPTLGMFLSIMNFLSAMAGFPSSIAGLNADISTAILMVRAECRAYGKAPTFSTSDTQAFKRAIDITDDELAAIAGRAKLTVV